MWSCQGLKWHHRSRRAFQRNDLSEENPVCLFMQFLEKKIVFIYWQRCIHIFLHRYVLHKSEICCTIGLLSVAEDAVFWGQALAWKNTLKKVKGIVVFCFANHHLNWKYNYTYATSKLQNIRMKQRNPYISIISFPHFFLNYINLNIAESRCSLRKFSNFMETIFICSLVIWKRYGDPVGLHLCTL